MEDVQHLEPLWRELVGAELRRERLLRGERLVDVARTAGVSTQYLSEVERGLKDASSELLAAVAGALDLTVADLARRAATPAPPRRDVAALRVVGSRPKGALALAA